MAHDFLIPLAPGFYRPGYKHMETDGMYPCAAFANGGELTINCAAAAVLGGNWTTQGNLTVKIFADVLYTHKAYLPGPIAIDTQDNTNAMVDLPKTPGKYECVLVMDNALAAFTLPTGVVQAECGGDKVIENITGAELVKLRSAGREDGLHDLFTNLYLPVILPTDAGSKFRQWAGSPFTLKDCNLSQADLLCKYVSVKYITLPSSEAGEVLSELKVKDGAMSNPSGYGVGGRKLVSANKTNSEKLGLTLSIEE
jgi:hypothetical protein